MFQAMFEIPKAKRVKRSDLFKSDSEPEDVDETVNDHPRKINSNPPNASSVEQPKTYIIPDYGFDYEIVNQVSNQQGASSEAVDEHAEESFSFNLFRPNPAGTGLLSSQVNDTTPTNIKISLRSPSPAEEDEGSFVQKSRPLHHFLVSALSEPELRRLREQYVYAALSGEQIHERSRSTKWQGSSLPWRVIHIPSNKLVDKTSVSQSLAKKSAVGDQSTKTFRKKKPSKKRRILTRQRLVARRAQRAATDRDLKAEQEKRTMKNRARKVKRKEKEKRKKLEAADVGAGGEGVANESTI